MGGIYAREAGEPEAVWKAIYFHYLPHAVEADAAPKPEHLGAGRVTWASVSLADKLDTLVQLFHAGERPTGSRDPFGLRRAAHGALRILLDVEALTGARVRPDLDDLLARASEGMEAPAGRDDLRTFLVERLQHILETRGADKRNVRSVLASVGRHGLRVHDVAENLKGLAEFARSEQFRQLATAFKRVRNIARELGDASADGDLRPLLKEPAEVALLDAIDAQRGPIDAAVRDGQNYRAAYAAAAAFEPIVARFFEEIFVMSDDAALRQARLRLMRRLETLILQLGDISEIVASE
jgi:glycyl-tRNA synthetase beta chain